MAKKGVEDKSKDKGKKKKAGNERKIPIGWFIVGIILAAIISFLLSYVVVSLANPSGNYMGDGTGTIVVQVKPDLANGQGKIVVDVQDSTSTSSESEGV